MTNPYDGGYPSYQPNPNPYDGPAAGPTGGRPLDGISVAALVCSLTCCAAPVGIGLGIGGLLRTRGGARSGRWAAVTGLVLGIVVLLAGIAFFAFAAVMGSRTVWPHEARVGQCIDVDFLGDPIKAACGEPHAGEVIWAGTFDDDLADAFDDSGVTEFCASLPGLGPVYHDAIANGDLRVKVESDAFDEDEPEAGDRFFCYLLGADDALTGPIEDSAATGA